MDLVVKYAENFATVINHVASVHLFDTSKTVFDDLNEALHQEYLKQIQEKGLSPVMVRIRCENRMGPMSERRHTTFIFGNEDEAKAFYACAENSLEIRSGVVNYPGTSELADERDSTVEATLTPLRAKKEELDQMESKPSNPGDPASGCDDDECPAHPSNKQ
jgi:hypothetical protein